MKELFKFVIQNKTITGFKKTHSYHKSALKCVEGEKDLYREEKLGIAASDMATPLVCLGQKIKNHHVNRPCCTLHEKVKYNFLSTLLCLNVTLLLVTFATM